MNRNSLKKYFPLFVLPTLIAFCLSFVVPFVLGVGLSFTEFTTVTNAKWCGFENYIKAFTDDASFLHALGFTFLSRSFPSSRSTYLPLPWHSF